MTFTIQEVPDWDISVEEFQMYDLTLSDILAEQDQCMTNCLMQRDEIKLEDPYAPTQYQPTTTSMLASPSMNMPVLCESYNPYIPSPQVVRSLASPSNTYVQSPADSSSYSASPIESPQQPLPPDDFMRYVARQQQPYSAAHVVPQANDYGYYYNNDCMGKRRRRDDELTPDEYEKRRLRRERNKQAALRCRNRRRERIEALEQETSEIEAQNEKVQIDISKLQSQIEELKDILKGHTCQKNINLTDASQSKSDQVKVKSDQVKVKPEPE